MKNTISIKSFATTMPEESLILQFIPADYIDAFGCKVMGSKKNLYADELMLHFWMMKPLWVNLLFKLRNILVRPFGLATGDDNERIENLKEIIRAGSGTVGIMSVVGKSENELTVLMRDKHLDAYISIIVLNKTDYEQAIVSTLVNYNNSLGKIYFFFIKPFHKIVVKSMLNTSIKKLMQ